MLVIVALVIGFLCQGLVCGAADAGKITWGWALLILALLALVFDAYLPL